MKVVCEIPGLLGKRLGGKADMDLQRIKCDEIEIQPIMSNKSVDFNRKWGESNMRRSERFINGL